MNLFILLRRPDGTEELVTSPLDKGTILPGVTRSEVMSAHAEGNLLEMFGSGTAAVVSPVGGLHYQGNLVNIPTPEQGLAPTIMAAMSDIYYGKVQSPWAIDVEEWNVDPHQVLTDYKQPEAATS